MALLRANIALDIPRAQKAFSMTASFLDSVPTCIPMATATVAKVRNKLHEVLEETVVEELTNVNVIINTNNKNNNDSGPFASAPARKSLVQQFSLRRKASGITGIPSGDGSLPATVEESVQAYIDYWANVFKPRKADRAAMTKVLRHADCSLASRVHKWEMPLSQFNEVIDAAKDSAPGPGG